MRIVIDMQGAQSASRYRGIGRYTMSFVRAVVRNSTQHEVILALNGLLSDSIDPIRDAFEGLLPQTNIRVWHALGPVSEGCAGNDERQKAAELLREAFLHSLEPDVIHVTSLFEGFVDDSITSIGKFDTTTAVSVTLYDLIPLLNSSHYLQPHPDYQRYYNRKIECLSRSAICLSISESAAAEGRTHLNLPREHFINVSTSVDPQFRPLTVQSVAAHRLLERFNIRQPFIMYTGGADPRKNLGALIHAYAQLPFRLRQSHQLLIVGKLARGDIDTLMKSAKAAGLVHEELCFSGYVEDEELVALLNLCKLFVFPSWHEGFGLPALEAMTCGAPVIAANASSLPEVIGLPEALFDPSDVSAISRKMAQALDDEAFRSLLTEHGLQRASLFSWDETARRAITAWERLESRRTSIRADLTDRLAPKRLVDALAEGLHKANPSAITGIAKCIAQNQLNGDRRQLFVDVSELCQRDAATGVQRVVRNYVRQLLDTPIRGFSVEPVYATIKEEYRYAREFTARLFGLPVTEAADLPVCWQRGDVFFGLDMQHDVQLAQSDFYSRLRRDGVVVKFLVYDLLPIQLAELFVMPEAKELHEAWLTMIASNDGAICISRATAAAYREWIDNNSVGCAPEFRLDWTHIGADIDGDDSDTEAPGAPAVPLLPLSNRLTFLCVATLEPRKRQQQILGACELLWDEGIDVSLVLVGQQGWHVDELVQRLDDHPEKGLHLFWLQGISDEHLAEIYRASTCLVAASINEGFGLPLIEAARYGKPLIVRDIPVFREVAGDHAFYFSGDDASDLATALLSWLELYRKNEHPRSAGMQWLSWRESTDRLKKLLLEKNYKRKQLLVDVSELAVHDAKTGIQRVVCRILAECLRHPPDNYRVEPVYATDSDGYRYAHHFTRKFLGLESVNVVDHPVEMAPGDVFIGLDLQPQIVSSQRACFTFMRQQGVTVKFVVYDLLPAVLPQHFPDGVREAFYVWLEAVAENDGAICISRSVAEELREWVAQRGAIRRRNFEIDWFHLGADYLNIGTAEETVIEDHSGLEGLSDKTSFLMVGTLEPRKGHSQILAAFEQLWRIGEDVALIIVGKPGWMVDALLDRIRTHAELGKRLFWLEGVSDADLDVAYRSADCLIAASEGEGFGLPLIEAAQHKLSIIARDIPVFREVAGDHAYYFSGMSSAALSDAIKSWTWLYKDHRHPTSSEIPWRTWSESAEALVGLIAPVAH